VIGSLFVSRIFFWGFAITHRNFCNFVTGTSPFSYLFPPSFSHFPLLVTPFGSSSPRHQRSFLIFYLPVHLCSFNPVPTPQISRSSPLGPTVPGFIVAAAIDHRLPPHFLSGFVDVHLGGLSLYSHFSSLPSPYSPFFFFFKATARLALGMTSKENEKHPEVLKDG